MAMTLRLNRLRVTLRKFYALDKTIILVLLLLCGINIVVQISANDDIFQRMINDIVYLSISFALLFIIANVTTGQLKHIAVPFYIISIIIIINILFY